MKTVVRRNILYFDFNIALHPRPQRYSYFNKAIIDGVGW